MLDDWWLAFPLTGQSKIRGEIRCGRDRAFRSSFFELYGFQLLIRTFDVVTEHPTRPNGTKPDFLASNRSGASLVVEMTSVAPEREATGAALSRVLDEIDEMELANVYLMLDVRQIGFQSPSTGRLKRELAAWVEGLDMVELDQSAGATDYLNGPRAPRYIWSEGDWQVTFRPLPRPHDKRHPRAHTIGTEGFHAFWADDALRMRKAFREKATKYELDDGSFVVAILGSGFGNDDEEVAQALYGDLRYTFPSDDPEAGRMTRAGNGAWFTSAGWRYGNVSALLYVNDLWPWSVTRVVPTLWHHPLATHPVDSIAPIFRQAIPNHESGQVDFIEPTMDPSSFFGLPDDWPGTEPRFS
jgi:hypothetical protein